MKTGGLWGMDQQVPSTTISDRSRQDGSYRLTGTLMVTEDEYNWGTEDIAESKGGG